MWNAMCSSTRSDATLSSILSACMREAVQSKIWKDIFPKNLKDNQAFFILIYHPTPSNSIWFDFMELKHETATFSHSLGLSKQSPHKWTLLWFWQKSHFNLEVFFFIVKLAVLPGEWGSLKKVQKLLLRRIIKVSSAPISPTFSPSSLIAF